MEKCVIASDSFKGTLSSKEIADIFEIEFKKSFPHALLEKVILGDGGENTLEVFSNHFKDGQYHRLEVTGPNFQKVNAKYFTYNKSAVIELAEASGLVLATERNPLNTTTFGVGELIFDAYLNGFRHFYVALGGSSSTDGGCGLLAALGVKFFNKLDEDFIPTGGTLSDITRIDDSDLQVKDAHIVILSDVSNKMYGEKGAAKVFAKQKGANEEQIDLLDKNLKYLNSLFKKDVSDIPGSGAAGATSAGMLAYLDAEIVSGIDTILDIIDFDSIIKDADYVFTGEGKLDSQSFDGKLISGVLKHTKNIPTICVCGKAEDNIPKDKFFAIYQTNCGETDFELIKKHAKENYINTIKDCFTKLNNQ